MPFVDLIDGESFEDLNYSTQADSSLVIVEWDHKVLLGFNVDRPILALSGGTLELAESTHDAAVRELPEETGTQVDKIAIIAVFTVILSNPPDQVESDELPLHFVGSKWRAVRRAGSPPRCRRS
jgi:8-oxo-dGTP pyrophosphatase MutT (NUDIX family)